jgi:Uma2 family endonuclease
MSAESISEEPRWTGPDPRRQRLADYTLEDVLKLPNDAPRVELRDGVMLVAPPPTIAHQNIANLLWMWFRQNAPDDFLATTATGVAGSVNRSLEPDVLLLYADLAEIETHFSTPNRVAIVVEVVSPSTRKRDRFEKPFEYAEAGIPFFWRIEQDPVHIHAYELSGGVYKLAHESDEELVLERPFAIRLPIRAITP